MPITTKFMSDVAGNGFPFCSTKVDVSGYDYWTTLSGWSKVSEPADDAAKAASIAVSRELAMKLYWNWYSANITGSSASFLESDDWPGGPTSNSGSLSIIEDDGSFFVAKPPIDRICNGGAKARAKDSTYVIANVRLTGFLRFYNGSIDNEDNYVGIGYVPSSLGSNFLISVIADITFTGATVRLHSAVTIEEEFFEPIIGETAYTTISGMHFVCVALASATAVTGDATRTRTPDAANASSSASRSRSITTPAATQQSDSSAKINSLDFYTYPA